MSQLAPTGDWADQVNEATPSTDRLTKVKDDIINGNAVKVEVQTTYAIKWGEKVEVSALSLLLLSGTG